MAKIRVRVTAKNIREGIAGKCQYCPVALALSRVFERPVATDSYAVYTCDTYGRFATLPNSVGDRIGEFDNTGIMEPFSFMLEYDESKLA